MKHPLIIGIGGAHSGSGKTTLAVALLKYLTKSEVRSQKSEVRHKKSVICPLSSGLWKKWGAIKYTRTAFYSSITDDITILGQKDKDTKRLLDAGAEEVLWVQSPAENIEEVMPLAVERLSVLEGIIIEGNSAIEFLKPDIVIFLLGSRTKRIKPSARAVFKHADIIVCDDLPSADGLLKNRKPQPQIFSLSSLDIKELIISMEVVIQKKEIARHLKANASLNEISCSLARKIAEDLGVTCSDVGKAADEIEIKIRNCELGCF
jgi:molybdopterin-guanine dinucleotide biosynthesis protein